MRTKVTRAAESLKPSEQSGDEVRPEDGVRLGEDGTLPRRRTKSRRLTSTNIVPS